MVKRTGFRGFTLIELLIVISIIALLAGLTASVAMNASRKRNVVRCMGRIREMKLAIEQFRVENNQYPWDLPVDDTTPPAISFSDVATELNPSNSLLANYGTVVHNHSKRDYVTFANTGSVKEINDTGQVVDPWGSEYKIFWNLDNDKVTIWSKGEDCVDDTEDDAQGTGDGSTGDDITSLK